ncbi:MAG: S8 family serine peptidase [Candidatus Aminicenantes bacterium]|jgi:subtilisin family serine protease
MSSIFRKKEALAVFSFLCIAFALTVFVYAFGPEFRSKFVRTPTQEDALYGLPDYAEGEVLVVFRKGVGPSAVRAIAESYYMDVKKFYPAIAKVQGKEIAHLISDFRTTEQLVMDLQGLPEVESVSPNFRQTICQTHPNDTLYSALWGLHNTGQTGGTPDIDIDAPEAWDYTTGDSVIVGVIDTGVDYNHPDLMANMWQNPGEIPGNGMDDDGNGFIDDVYGINAITMTGDPLDDHGHGTHCAGTIGGVGNNSMGVVGVNWNVKIIGAKFISEAGSGWDSDAVTCIDYLTDLKITYGQNIVVTNNSWGGGAYNAALKTAIDASGSAGIVFCAAAGNDGTDNDVSPHYPSSYTSSNIIAVTAVDHDGLQYYNYGATSVDIAAPGRDIVSTYRGIYSPQPGDPFYDDMESGSGLWTHGGTLDSWGITNAGAGGLESYWWDMSYGDFWSDSPGAGYVHNIDNWLAPSSNIDLSSYSGQDVWLVFDGGFQFDYFISYDTAKIEISNNGGSTWATLADLTTLYSGYGYYYMSQIYEIPEAYKTSMFKFRFHITSDDTDYNYYGYRNKGWIIDNVGVGNAMTYGYTSMNGTSMATPHVSGAVALCASVYAPETVAERITRILNSSNALPSLSGKCVTGGMLNVYDALMYCAAPEIHVRLAGVNFADGSTKNLGTRTSSFVMGKEFPFKIENKGLIPLNLTGTPKVTLSGPQAAHFYVSQQPTSPVSGLGQTIFKLRTVRDSLPGALPVGWTVPISFTVNIANDDSDENPYDFTINFTLEKDS